MNQKYDGGTAFPMQDGHVIHVYAAGASAGIADPEERDTAYRKARADAIGGLSKREYFAAHAPTTLQDALDFLGRLGSKDPMQHVVFEMMAQMRYGYADAMLAEATNQAAAGEAQDEAHDALDAMRAYFPKAETLYDCYRGIEALEQQRDQLLAALERASATLAELNDMPSMRADMNAAIAAVKAGAK